MQIQIRKRNKTTMIISALSQSQFSSWGLETVVCNKQELFAESGQMMGIVWRQGVTTRVTSHSHNRSDWRLL